MRAHILRLVVVLAGAVLAAGACASPDGGADARSTTPPPTAAATSSATASIPASPTPGAGGGALPDGLRARPEVAAAIADTASREQVAPEQVVIAAWSPVTWNDGSLGCPQEGMSYTQALLDGELLMLRTGTGLFQYHAATGGPFAYCATPSASYTVGR